MIVSLQTHSLGLRSWGRAPKFTDNCFYKQIEGEEAIAHGRAIDPR